MSNCSTDALPNSSRAGVPPSNEAQLVGRAALDDDAELTAWVDVSENTGISVAGRLTAWITGQANDVEHVAGRSPGGDLMVFFRSPRTDGWQVVNASDEAGAGIDGPVTSWVTASEDVTVEHLAGRNASGDLLVFWWSPRAGHWQVMNASDEAGARIDGPVTSWITGQANDVEHVAGRSPDGDLMAFFRSPRTDGWQVVNASDEAGAGIDGPVTSWVTASGDMTVEHLAGRNASGDLLVFWWSPRAGHWQVVNASDEAGLGIDGPVTSWVTASGDVTVEHLAGRNASGDLLVFWWSPRAGHWQVVNASDLAAGTNIGGRPDAYESGNGTEVVVAGGDPSGLVMHWWSPELDWQACDLLEGTGIRLASSPVAWQTPGAGTPEMIAACTDDDRLLVLESSGLERRLTDSVQHSLFGMRPLRRVRRKVLTILWDPDKPDVPPRADRSTMEDVIHGAMDSVRQYYLENSGGMFTIEDAGVLGWYDADFSPSEYWPPDGSVGRDSGAEAIRRAAEDIDFSAFDADGDGQLQTDEVMILFVLPGTGDGGGLIRVVGEDFVPRGEAEGIVVDGVKITTIAEVSIGSPPQPGIVAHELSHTLLGLGDMYFTFFNPSAAGPYSLMDQDGEAPHLDPANKLKLGWLRPKLVFRPGTYDLPDVETSQVVRVLIDPEHGTDEYVLVENRWPGSSFDTAIPHSGLGVWHVIEDSTTFESSVPPGVDPDEWDDTGGFSRKGIRMVRPIQASSFGATLPLWDGSDPDTGYDLLPEDNDPEHAELRWADGSPSGFAVLDIPPSQQTMSIRFETA